LVFVSKKSANTIGSAFNQRSGKSKAMEDMSTKAGSTAIVGMACRVAGANNPTKLWDNIIDKVDLQQEIPSERFNIDRFHHPNGQHKGTVSRPQYTHSIYCFLPQPPDKREIWLLC
jgi:hypothetical protein